MYDIRNIFDDYQIFTMKREGARMLYDHDDNNIDL